MKGKFLKGILIMSFLALLVIAGCGQTQPPASTYIPPQTCSLTIYSQCFTCYGYVWVNGLSTGKYLDFNGMVQVTVPCGVVSVELRDEFGWISTPRIVQTPQTSILIIDYW